MPDNHSSTPTHINLYDFTKIKSFYIVILNKHFSIDLEQQD